MLPGPELALLQVAIKRKRKKRNLQSSSVGSQDKSMYASSSGGRALFIQDKRSRVRGSGTAEF